MEVRFVNVASRTRGGGLDVFRDGTWADQAVAPESIINYVVRTHETVILEDAQNSRSADDYINRQKPRSILCLPLINQGKLTGVLYSFFREKRGIGKRELVG
jgi:GAF domain-containing protein